MSHNIGPAAINNRQTTYTAEILDTLFVQLAAHPLINNPPVWDRQGNPIRITKFKNFDGIELQNSSPGELTLSVYPYSYVKDESSTLTSTSTNASLVYRPYTLGNGGTPMGPMDKCIAHVGFKLHYVGYDQSSYIDHNVVQNQQTIYELNHAESVLHNWAEILRLILTSDLRRLPSLSVPRRHLLTNSFVQWINFNSGRWTDGPNLIFHTATLLWSAEHYPKRILEHDEAVNFVGSTLGTIPDPANPGQSIEVWYDLTSDRYYNGATNETLPPVSLIDPATGSWYATLDVAVVQVLDSISRVRLG